jgi:RimK family alpha-L-glutamate ligase
LDALIVRAIPDGSLEQIIFRMDALARIERANTWVINPARAIERTVDKYYTTTLLAEAGLKVAPTIVTECFDDAMSAFDELGCDVVVKPIFGSEGRGMVRIDDIDLAHRTFKALEFGRYVYYIQKFIPHSGRDWRAFIIEDHVVAAMERRSSNWKTNYSQGAQVAPLNLPDHLVEASIKAAKIIDCQIAGVDLLPAEDGEVYFTEVNSIPGWRGLYKATGIAIHDLIVDYVIKGLIAH